MSIFTIKENEIHLRTCGNCEHFKRVTEVSLGKLKGELLPSGHEKCHQGIIFFRCELYGGIGNNCDSVDCAEWKQR